MFYGRGDGRRSGQGRGIGSNRNSNSGFGPGGSCICPNCGREVAHQRGVPCYELKCPACGSPMTRKGLNNIGSTGTDDINNIPVIDGEECIGCEKCLEVCPFNAIRMNAGTAEIIADKCRNCHRCMSVCPVEAIK
ncbi:MAG: H+/Na+-translocating ferredoxin:NAD+ oxidoreductase subunit [Halanaerobiales bacterium]|nr:H+/Na+-translocating ferredoxin:NAD+ oxidoreductase subunit [Halanaerobiales bacterium]